MKNKKVTYLLVFIVLLIWGKIIYQVFIVAKGDEEPLPQATRVMAKEPYNDYATSRDTALLSLHYRDPFSSADAKDTSEIPLKKILQQSPHPILVKPAMNWGFIQYAGYIHNPVSKKLIAIVSINGKSEMLSVGQNKDRVRLIKNLRDSILISFDGKTKFIALKPPSL